MASAGVDKKWRWQQGNVVAEPSRAAHIIARARGLGSGSRVRRPAVAMALRRQSNATPIPNSAPDQNRDKAERQFCARRQAPVQSLVILSFVDDKDYRGYNIPSEHFIDTKSDSTVYRRHKVVLCEYVVNRITL